jgi:hypothetical protein
LVESYSGGPQKKFLWGWVYRILSEYCPVALSLLLLLHIAVIWLFMIAFTIRGIAL